MRIYGFFMKDYLTDRIVRLIPAVLQKRSVLHFMAGNGIWLKPENTLNHKGFQHSFALLESAVNIFIVSKNMEK